MNYRTFFITIFAIFVSISEAQNQSEDARRMCDYDGVGCVDSELQMLIDDLSEYTPLGTAVVPTVPGGHGVR